VTKTNIIQWSDKQTSSKTNKHADKPGDMLRDIYTHIDIADLQHTVEV